MTDADFAEGKAFVIGPCLTCKRLFTYNPLTVCSHPWPIPDGPNEPICFPCITKVNAARAAEGRPTWTIHPGAYHAEGAP
jgi:hypothetical protein